MRHLAYLAMLVVCLLGTLPLELRLRTGVYRQPRRLALTLLPVVVVFTAWDLYAIARHQWWFDPRQTLGVRLPGGLPVEELMFFVVVPVCAILTLEAVRRVKGARPGWLIGDEPDAGEPAGDPARGVDPRESLTRNEPPR